MENCRGLLLKELNGFDDFVESTMEEWRVPGLELSVVKNGEPVYSNGYGHRDPDKGLKMSADTLYRMASNTKAFTSMAAAMLVDEGKLEWDKPVREYLPYFRLQDAYATEHVTVRDLLCHRTGLPAHDRALRQCGSRKEAVEKLRYLEPSCPIRTRLQYNNKMFLAAGHLVEYVAGQSWESFVQERIFNALGMEKSNFSFPESRRSGNFAECFYLKDGELKQYTENKRAARYSALLNPADGINSTANDISKWMILQLNRGEYRGKRVVSEKAFDEMHSLQMVDNWNSPYEEHGESGCGLGWFIWSYRGYKLVLHEGFYGSHIYLVPRRKLGIAFMPTLKSPFSDVVIFNLLDRMLGLDPVNWNERKRREREEALENQSAPVSDRKPGTRPSHALSGYCGMFAEPAYGKLDIRTNGANLFVKEENGAELELRHYHYDTFELLNEDGEAAFRLTFHTDAKGEVSSASSPRESGVKDIIYRRER